jgi:hypothetical protein
MVLGAVWEFTLLSNIPDSKHQYLLQLSGGSPGSERKKYYRTIKGRFLPCLFLWQHILKRLIPVHVFRTADGR